MMIKRATMQTPALPPSKSPPLAGTKSTGVCQIKIDAIFNADMLSVVLT